MGTYETIECPAELFAQLQRERHGVTERGTARLITHAQRITGAESERLIAQAERIKLAYSSRQQLNTKGTGDDQVPVV